MKKMTCSQLGGACKVEFIAESFEEMAKLSRKHGLEMMQKGDSAHLIAMEKMKQLMKEQGAMEKWYQERKDEFDSLPHI